MREHPTQEGAFMNEPMSRTRDSRPWSNSALLRWFIVYQKYNNVLNQDYELACYIFYGNKAAFTRIYGSDNS